jgi:hypothetical protein
MTPPKKVDLSPATQTINDGLATLPEPRIKVVTTVTNSPPKEKKPDQVITSTSILSTRAE